MTALFTITITALIVLATTAVLVGRGPVRDSGQGSGGPNHRVVPPYDSAAADDDDTDVADPEPGQR
ncbi:hypothetical protein [Streptomyces sp. SD15]